MTSLTKWPRLIVQGGPVTPEQANDILIRTDGWRFLTTDQRWRAEVYEAFGINDDPATIAARKAQLGGLDLRYLHNSRIMTPSGVGPHGWCDWNGTIGCVNYNIGPFPAIDHITEDWQTIATAFPYLALRAQALPLPDADAGPDAYRSPVEWHLRNGNVYVITHPAEPIREPHEPTEADRVRRIFGSFVERGVSVPRLYAAVAQVAASRPAPVEPTPPPTSLGQRVLGWFGYIPETPAPAAPVLPALPELPERYRRQLGLNDPYHPDRRPWEDLVNQPAAHQPDPGPWFAATAPLTQRPQPGQLTNRPRPESPDSFRATHDAQPRRRDEPPTLKTWPGFGIPDYSVYQPPTPEPQSALAPASDPVPTFTDQAAASGDTSSSTSGGSGE